MFDDITKFAALVSTKLNQVDKNMLSQGSAGSANKINVRNFIQPAQQSGPPPAPANAGGLPPPAVQQAEPLNLIPMPQPATPPPAPPPVVAPPVAPTIASEDIKMVVKQLTNIATELAKINKKLTSVQKFCNSKKGG